MSLIVVPSFFLGKKTGRKQLCIISSAQFLAQSCTPQLLIYFMHLCFHAENTQTRKPTSLLLKEQVDIVRIWCDRCWVSSFPYRLQVV